MSKRARKLTRRHKSCLRALDDEFRTAKQIGASESILDDLASHGLVCSSLEMGEMRYRITDAGRDRLLSYAAETEAA